jgi:hypothetical protein
VPDYKLTVVDPGNALEGLSWKKYHADRPLEYGNEITIEAEEADASGAARTIRARVVEVDNDAFFTKKATVEPLGEN